MGPLYIVRYRLNKNHPIQTQNFGPYLSDAKALIADLEREGYTYIRLLTRSEGEK